MLHGWPCSAGRPRSTVPEGECCLREGCLQPRSRPLPFPLCGEACVPHSAPCTECAVTTPARNLSRPVLGGNQHCKASCQPWPRHPQGEQLAGAGGPPETALPSSFGRKTRGNLETRTSVMNVARAGVMRSPCPGAPRVGRGGRPSPLSPQGAGCAGLNLRPAVSFACFSPASV